MFYLEAEQYFLNWEFLFNQLKAGFSFSLYLKWPLQDNKVINGLYNSLVPKFGPMKNTLSAQIQPHSWIEPQPLEK